MNTAVDSTAIELRRGASSTLKLADRSGRGLGEYSNHNSSDISGVYCGSELHSPMSVDSSASSEKILSPSGSLRNHSDISDGCPSPVDKDEGFLEPDMIPSSDSPRTPPSAISNKTPLESNADIDEEDAGEPRDFSGLNRKSKTVGAVNVDDSDRMGPEANSDQKQMVDIVGGASSPGEFFDHALEFINGREKENRHQWTSGDLRRSRLRDEETDTPRSKRVKTSATYDDEFSMCQSQTKSTLRHKSTYDKSDSSRTHPYGRYDTKAKLFYNPVRREHRKSSLHSLSPDQKFFVETFINELASAAEQVAEASALRVLQILDGQGICFSRFVGKSRFESRSLPESTSKYPIGKLDPIHTSSPTLDDRHDSDDLQTHEDVLIPTLKGHYTSEKEDLPSAPSNRNHGRIEERGVANKEGLDLCRHRTPTDAMKKDISFENSRHMDADHTKEQTHALSLVTTQNRASRSSTIDSDSTVPSSKASRQQAKSSSLTAHESAVRPFVRSPHAPSKSRQYGTSFAGYETSSPSSKQVDYSATSDKFLRDGSSAEMSSERRKYGMSESLASGKVMDYSSYPLGLPISPKTKNSMKSRGADSYKEEKKRSLNLREEKTQSEMNIPPSSLALHGVPSGSAFRKHQMRRSPVSGGMRSLRSNASPESKPFPHPGPFSMMYNPFANLPFPLGVPQSPHLAAVSLLASFNQRQNQNDYRNMRTNQSTLASERIPVHPSLRGHPNGSYLGDHHGYEVDPSSYAFPNNIQEGLTPQHLKKAKLMFFYTRYPNANTLKTYFPDVKFTRAITSQLIKWFSNFREFFYIQMEKFARQAITDGAHDASMLRVTRDCELFRVLNLHYNKCNEFRVPSTFLNAAEASQREFYIAVKAGKDTDPAWKKVIYKVICKLDSEIPELFKSPNVLDRLHDIRDQ